MGTLKIIIAALEALTAATGAGEMVEVPVKLLREHCYCDELVDQEWTSPTSSHGTFAKCDWCKALAAINGGK